MGREEATKYARGEKRERERRKEGENPVKPGNGPDRVIAKTTLGPGLQKGNINLQN